MFADGFVISRKLLDFPVLSNAPVRWQFTNKPRTKPINAPMKNSSVNVNIFRKTGLLDMFCLFCLTVFIVFCCWFSESKRLVLASIIKSCDDA